MMISGAHVPWPRVSTVEVAWHPTLPDDLVPRSQRRHHRGPYRAAVVPPVAAAIPLLSSTIAAAADDATRAIARFDAEMGHELTGLEAVLLRSESASSSQIEHLTAGARAIALAEIGGENNPATMNAHLVAANASSMRAALDRAGAIDEAMVLAVHDVLLREHAPSIAGRWRSAQVWIGGTGYGPHGASFVPPTHEHVEAAMTDLVAFIARTDVPVLTHAAIAHAHFETIHPFPDGNGRTGRALLQAMLRAGGLTRTSTPPVSAGLLTDVDSYVAALAAYRDGDLDAIVETVAQAALTGIANSRRLVEELREVRRRWDQVVPARRDAVVWRVADILVRSPVVTAAIVIEETGATSANAHRALRTLVESGVITELGGRRRGRFWQSREVLDAVDAFADRAGRRG